MENFINRNQGTKEPGVVIVEDQNDLILVVDLLVGYGFYVPQDIQGAINMLQKSHRVCISEEQIKSDSTNFYDLVLDVATGSEQKINTNLSKDSNFILVVTVEFFESESVQGRDWLSVCGLSWQFTE